MTISSPGLHLLPSARARWKVRVVILAPKAISTGCATRKSASAIRERAMARSVSWLGGVAQWGVGVVVVEVVGHRLDHIPGHLSPSRAIEVGDRLMALFALQRWEASPDCLD